MNKVRVALFAVLVLHASAHAADKIKIGVPELNAQYLPLHLEKRGVSFERTDFREKSSASIPPLHSQH